MPHGATKTVFAAAPLVPSAPYGVWTVNGDTKACPWWTCNEDNGCAAHIITAYSGGAAGPWAVVPAPSTFGMITGLTNGTAYQFTIRAANQFGWSPESALTAAVTPQAGVIVPPSLVASWPVTTTTSTNPLVTPAFCPWPGDLIVVKAVTPSASTTFSNAPVCSAVTGGFTATADSTAGYTACYLAYGWATAAAPSTVSLTVTGTVPAQWSILAEQWRNASSGPSLTVTQDNYTSNRTVSPATAKGSVLSWLWGDVNAANDGTLRTFDTSTATPVPENYIWAPA